MARILRWTAVAGLLAIGWLSITGHQSLYYLVPIAWTLLAIGAVYATIRTRRRGTKVAEKLNPVASSMKIVNDMYLARPSYPPPTYGRMDDPRSLTVESYGDPEGDLTAGTHTHPR